MFADRCWCRGIGERLRRQKAEWISRTKANTAAIAILINPTR
jgi:hypothetical protein